jgi:L-2,4-diaminobutyric acid acetyltransferase
VRPALDTSLCCTPGHPDRIRPPDPADGKAVWELARSSGLDENSPYAYLMWASYFSGTSLVAERGESLVGFVNGFRVPDDASTLFVWQIAVRRGAEGTGTASALLDALVSRNPDVRWLEATVTTSNERSAALFRRFAAERSAALEEVLAFGEDLFPAGGHEAEIRFRIGPFSVR